MRCGFVSELLERFSGFFTEIAHLLERVFSKVQNVAR